MTDPSPVSTRVAAYYRALDDISAVLRVGTYLVDDKQDVLPADVRRLLVTGVVVTYARPFMSGSGYPLPLRRLVPSEHRALHHELMTRRRKLEGHTDDDAPEHLRRVIERIDGEHPSIRGAKTTWHGKNPAPMTKDELRDVARLARLMVETLVDELVEALHEDRAHEDPPDVGRVSRRGARGKSSAPP